jgi:ribosomal protein L16 Arg81 hydroxylase
MPVPTDEEDVFSWLVSPVSRDLFLREHFGKEPMLVQGRGSDHYAGLFDLEDLERMAFSEPDGLREGLQLLVGREAIPVSPGPLAPQLRSAFYRGATVQIDSVGRFVPSVARIQRRLEESVGGEVHFNLYFSPPRAKVFPAHADHHDGFVLQVRGEKHWKVYGDRPELVSASLRREAPPPPERLGPPIWTPKLERGDLLYLPLGRFHAAETADEESLHLTIGLYPYTAGRLLLDVLRRLAASDAAFLESVARWAPGERGPRLRALAERLLNDVDVDREYAAHWTALVSAMPVLPDGLFAGGPPLERADQVVRKRPGMVCSVVSGSGRVALLFPGAASTRPSGWTRRCASSPRRRVRSARATFRAPCPRKRSWSWSDASSGRGFWPCRRPEARESDVAARVPSGEPTGPLQRRASTKSE